MKTKPQLKIGQIWALDVGAHVRITNIEQKKDHQVVTGIAISKYSHQLITINTLKSTVNLTTLTINRTILKDFLTRMEILKYLFAYNIIWRWNNQCKTK